MTVSHQQVAAVLLAAAAIAKIRFVTPSALRASSEQVSPVNHVQRESSEEPVLSVVEGVSFLEGDSSLVSRLQETSTLTHD